jgi:large subunit ribosomal protein L31
MKTGIHPEIFETTVHCNGCNTTFTTHSTVKEITVEICSNCHPFYTGKHKLIDTAGRVDKFKARQAQATKRAEERAAAKNKKDAELAKIQAELQSETTEGGEASKDQSQPKAKSKAKAKTEA